MRCGLHRTRPLLLAAVFCLPVILTSCSTGDDGVELGRDHVTAVVLPFLSQMPFHIAAEEGFFAEQNLDVDFLRVGRNQDIMAVLAQGDVDVAAGMLTLNELSLASAGAPIRVVAALTTSTPDQCTFAAVVVRREHLESGALDDRDQISRFRFDINPFIPLGYAVDELLRSYDLTLDDVDTVDLPPPAALDSLRRGLVDVTADSEPWISMHVATGEAVIWRSVGELIPNYVHSVLMFGPALIDERPEVGERFMVAILKAVRQLRLGKTARNLAIVEKASGLTAEQVAGACWPMPSHDARIDATAFRGYQEWSVGRGLLDRVLLENELFDHRFIDHANVELAK